ncbi:hypothetical protein Tco_1351281 [Tanacetum coccineum]
MPLNIDSLIETPDLSRPRLFGGSMGHFKSYFLNMDLFNLISALNPTKVKTGTRPCVAHEVPLLTATTNNVIVMEDAIMALGSSGTPSTMEKSPLDFANEDLPQRITEGDGTTCQAQDELS